MCAIMPIFLQRSNGTCLGTIFFRFLLCGSPSASNLGMRATSPAITQSLGAPPYRLLLAVGRDRTRLPAVVGEGLVRFGHAMHVFFLLDGRAAAVGRIEQLVRQLVDHALRRVRGCRSGSN